MIDSLKDEQDQTSFYKIHIDFSQGFSHLSVYFLTIFYIIYSTNLSDH